jgi:glycosyltransferase involved in cell wall biosynthesis
MHEPANNNNYRIAWVISGDEVYGVRTAIRNLMSGLEQQGHTVAAIAIGEGALADELDAEGRMITRLRAEPPRRVGRSWKRRIPYMYLNWRRSRTLIAPVAKALQEWNATAAHVLWPTLMPIAGAAAKHARIPCFWEMPNIVGNTYPFALNRRYLQWTCHRLRVQPLSNSAYTARTLGDKPVKPIVLYLGVDQQRFDPDDTTPHPAIRDAAAGRPVFGVAARIDPTKGQMVLVQAIALLAPEQRPLLAIIGGPTEDPHAEAIRQEAARLGLQRDIIFTGPLAEVEAAYAAIDVLVNACLIPEAFGLTVIEAMLMRRPVLAHALGGPTETVRPGHTGWLVKDPSPQGFAEAFRTALAHRDRWPEMGRAGRDRALAEFTIEAETRRYLAALQDRLSSRPPPAP